MNSIINCIRPSIHPEDRWSLKEQSPRLSLECYEELVTLDTTSKSHWTCRDSDFAILLQQKEKSYMCNPFYLYTMQPQVTPVMRAILGDWLIEVSSEFTFKRSTAHLAICITDRFLSVCSDIKRDKYQLVGLTALFLAAKYEEISVPSISKFLEAANKIFTQSELKKTERMMLNKLSWKINTFTPFSVLNWLMLQWDIFTASLYVSHSLSFKFPNQESYKRFRDTVHLLDLVALDTESLRFSPSKLAASAIIWALNRDGIDDLTITEFLTGCFGNCSVQDFAESSRVLRKFENCHGVDEMPSVCKLAPADILQSHYEDFQNYQTHSKTSLPFAKLVLKSYV